MSGSCSRTASAAHYRLGLIAEHAGKATEGGAVASAEEAADVLGQGEREEDLGRSEATGLDHDRAVVARMAGATFGTYPSGTHTFRRVVIGGEPLAADNMTARVIDPPGHLAGGDQRQSTGIDAGDPFEREAKLAFDRLGQRYQ